MSCSSSCNGSGQMPGTQNLVFLNKIFYENSASSCPHIFDLITDTANFTQTLSIGQNHTSCDCGCSCGESGCGSSGNSSCHCGCNSCNGCSCCYVCCGIPDFEVTPASTFTITNSCCVINSIAVSGETPLAAEDITIDGFPVSGLTYENGRYHAELSGIMADITRCACQPRDRHLCCGCGLENNCPEPCDGDRHFFLTEAAGPWEITLSIVLEGYVTSGNATRDFKLCLKSRNDTGASQAITVPGAGNFALNCVDIPCQTEGISPSLIFDFDGCAVLLNPQIDVTAATETEPQEIVLSANLVLTPSLSLQVIRPTRFTINALEETALCDDIGQCDPCAQSCCCQDSSQQPVQPIQPFQPAMTAREKIASQRRNLRSHAATANTACQCCDTNGYRF